ncbi:TIGR02206 family membrane protein [Nocardioides dubius]|uniref:TIGR02206 family membrane protein n=1 Tax=Nocardioides dubius TaxID=317019 RepID=A0ABP4E9P4_9ACTN
MWAEESTRFTTFGPVHVIMLVTFVLVCVPLVRCGRRHRGTGREVRFSRAFAVLIPVVTVPMQLLQLTPSEWDLDTSLPLQICDFAWVLASYALWTRKRWAAGVSWLWGLTLTLQGMLTPDLASGWAEPRFAMFWAMHWLIVWSAVYLVWGLGLYPGWRELRIAIGLTSLWAAGVMTFNAIIGTNYGYLNGKPNNASALDYLGPWPSYVVIEVAIVIAVWTLMTWACVRRTRTAAG